MAYSALAIANELLDLGDRDGIVLTPMKLMKIAYLAHGFHLAVTGEPLLIERPEAWTYGPAVPSIYYRFRRFGSEAVTDRARDPRGRAYTIPAASGNAGSGGAISGAAGSDEAARAREVIDVVWDTYKGLTALELADLTQQSGTPWDRARRALGEYDVRGYPISGAALREYYGQFVTAA